MKKYYIQYHKAEDLGLPYREPKYDGTNDCFVNGLRFFTKKKVLENAINSICFLIVGFGKKGKMNFYLWSSINIEFVEFKEPLYWAEGSGIQFKNPILLNSFDNFMELKDFTGNFGLGFTDISKLKIANDFIKIADDYENQLSKTRDLENDWEKIKEARKLSISERAEILKKSNKKPEKTRVSVTVYKRNIYVIAETLERAKGVCEKCNNPAPFTKDKDGSEYLEVHHKVPLSENGDDTIENTIALCPNCHRHAHYGINTYNDNDR